MQNYGMVENESPVNANFVIGNRLYMKSLSKPDHTGYSEGILRLLRLFPARRQAT